MCGIVGYVGKNISVKKILAKLQNLEYRGYDSAGFAYIKNNNIVCRKKVGQIVNLINATNDQEQADICICHTRWATHGKVCENNAHPQVSYNNNFAVVHNGIIENYNQIKEKIGINKFSSQTDSEVIANLMEEISGAIETRFFEMLKKISGSYAICLIERSSKKLYVAKNKSPLYISQTEDGYFVASDISCFEGNDYYSLEDGMCAIIDKDNLKFYKDNKPYKLQKTKNIYHIDDIKLSKFSHFMQKEIAETPQILFNIAKTYSKLVETIKYKNLFNNIKNVVLSGCGTAFHACLLGEEWINDTYNLNARAYIASELRYKENIIDKNTLVLLVSQSGETADTLAVMNMAKEIGAKVVAMTNIEYSTLAGGADFVLPLCAGQEIGVASTKVYSAMLAVFYILSTKNAKNTGCFNKIITFSRQISAKFDKNIIEIVQKSKRVFFIGRGYDGITAQEGALKLKEITYKDACGYYAGELKHGTIALVDENTIVFAIITNKNIAAKTLNAVEEVCSRGAKVVVLTDQNLSGNFNYIKLQTAADEKLAAIAAVLPLQSLAYEVAVKCGFNPDRPRNLAKSVTVE